MVNMTTMLGDGTLPGILIGINQESGGLLGVGIYVAILVVSFGISIKSGSRDAFAAASFVSGLSGMILRLAQIITNDAIVFLSIVFLIVAAVMLIWRQERV